ncbi:Acyl-CoA dehydrogenase [Aquisphaera giovannonii]|uniref:Acyl-CoA dehydrogenase n=1 Tax=Aquisphaera giovannonii TaxID=406548 RepID=A0A5B9VUR2_9BACT|nr:acyl-CoA dehydrogenase family protein [Aquisphaera giovannonii]QEH31824.1 Acyl-CoA dehydrogenase [Aquisphaera giovannonii]
MDRGSSGVIPDHVALAQADDLGRGRPGELARVLDWCRGYFGRRVNFFLADQRRSFPPHVLIDLGNRGLMGMVSERSRGGLGLEIADAMRLVEYVAAIDQSLAVGLIIQNFLAGQAVRNHGHGIGEGVHEDIARGRLLISFALTEDAAGSDPRRIATRAVRQGQGEWMLSGSKIWSGFAAWSGAMVTFARTDAGPDAGRSYSAFYVPQDTPGVRQGDEHLTMGLRAIIQNRIHFDGVRLAPNLVLGPVGGGLEIAQESMMLCRLAMGALSVGAMRRALQYAFAYATRREIATGPMIKNPIVASVLAEESARTLAAGSYLEHLYSALGSGTAIPDEYLLTCKIVLPEWMWQTVDRSLQLLGGRGYDEANGLARLFRDARVTRIFEGSTEVMASHLGGRVRLNLGTFSDRLRRDLDASAIADDFDEAVKIDLGKPTGGRPAQLHGRYRLGLLAAYALVAAVNRFRSEQGRGGPSAAAAFAEGEYFRRSRTFRESAWPLGGELDGLNLEAMADILEGLPDLDAGAAGEHTRIDPYLGARS